MAPASHVPALPNANQRVDGYSRMRAMTIKQSIHTPHMHASTVLACSGPFRAAVVTGNGNEALRLGRQIMSACQAKVHELDAPNTQESLHYQTIALETSRTLQEMGISNVWQDIQVVETHSRPAEILGITDRLEYVSTLLAAISDLIFRAEPMVTAYSRSIEDAATSTEQANDALLLGLLDAQPGNACSLACLAARCRMWPRCTLCMCMTLTIILLQIL